MRSPWLSAGAATIVLAAVLGACGDDGLPAQRELLTPPQGAARDASDDGTTADASADAAPVHADFGLDARPVNATCKAPARPANAAPVMLQRVFANVALPGGTSA